MASSTRERLGAALKAELLKEPIDKITVSGLSALVGINRQTFYYHFNDVYDLAVWVFEQEIANHIMEHATYTQWAEGYRTLLQYMRANYDQTRAVLNSLTHRERDAFFLGQFRGMMRAIVDEVGADLVLTEEDRQFVIDHYAVTVHGHLLLWLATNAKEDPDVLVPKIERILHGHVRDSLKRFAKPSISRSKSGGVTDSESGSP